LVITLTGLAISFYVSLKTSLLIIVANTICALLLWVYSTTFKKKLLSGNIIISGLTAWTVLVLYFAVNTTLSLTEAKLPGEVEAMHRIYKYAVLYAGFAFIISLIREVVKDIEDMEGDEKYNCKTMPIVWGVPATKVFVGVWMVVLIGALAIIQFYAMQNGWWWSVIYLTMLVIVPLAWILKKFYQAQTTTQYHFISNMIKLVMLTGICSILLMKLY
jgi:4-hydroxybenzoate polyprenyltransferase